MVDGGRGGAGGGGDVTHTGDGADDLIEAGLGEAIGGPVEDGGPARAPGPSRTGVRFGHRETLAHRTASRYGVHMTGTESHISGPQTAFVPAWDGTAYAANTAHHRAYDNGYLATTPLRPGDRALDLGCGSGDLTATIAELVGVDGHVVGVDAQPSMLDEARMRARANQSFVLSPVQGLDDAFGPEHDATFDVVLSRAVLHWVPAADLPGVYRSAARLLKPGGWFRVECGGAGNIPKPLALMDDVSTTLGGPTCPWNFADPASALDGLEAAGLDAVTDDRAFVRCVGQRRQFDETTLTGWLDSQVLHAYEAWLPEATHAEFRQTVKARLEELRRADGTFDQTWVRLDLLARRP